jgi:hypothetical protein
MPNRVVITKSDSHPHRFRSPFAGDDYALLIVISDATVSEEEQREISREIVKTGCRYALAYGHACSSWDDSIDLADIEAGENPHRFIMTTWHDDEPIEDVVDFWWLNTAFEDYVPENFGVFFIGSNPSLERAVIQRISHHQTKEAEQNAAPNSLRGFRPP